MKIIPRQDLPWGSGILAAGVEVAMTDPKAAQALVDCGLADFPQTTTEIQSDKE